LASPVIKASYLSQEYLRAISFYETFQLLNAIKSAGGEQLKTVLQTGTMPSIISDMFTLTKFGVFVPKLLAENNTS